MQRVGLPSRVPGARVLRLAPALGENPERSSNDQDDELEPRQSMARMNRHKRPCSRTVSGSVGVIATGKETGPIEGCITGGRSGLRVSDSLVVSSSEAEASRMGYNTYGWGVEEFSEMSSGAYSSSSATGANTGAGVCLGSGFG